MKISDFRRHEASAPVEALACGATLSGRPAFFSATVELGDGVRVGDEIRVSRYDGESSWIVDGQWKGESVFPIFWNGEGSRCTALVTLSDAVVAAELDRLADLASIA